MKYFAGLVVLLGLIQLQHVCEAQISYPLKAVAALAGQITNPNTGEASTINGYVTLQQDLPNGVLRVFANLTGLIPGLNNTNHGFHVHTLGINSTSNNATIRCGTTGSHYNPYSMNHGDISFEIRHVGDYGNIQVDADGSIQTYLLDTVSHLDGPFSIIGRSLVLHAGEDDKGLNPDSGSKTTGNSGARVACGVIGYA